MANTYMFNNHLLKACLAAVITVGLAACGGSGGGTPMTDLEPMPQESCEADGGRRNAGGRRSECWARRGPVRSAVVATISLVVRPYQVHRIAKAPAAVTQMRDPPWKDSGASLGACGSQLVHSTADGKLTGSRSACFRKRHRRERAREATPCSRHSSKCPGPCQTRLVMSIAVASRTNTAPATCPSG